ncbi:MAG: DoxX family protein, partial [Gemmatimonadota bacterium]
MERRAAVNRPVLHFFRWLAAAFFVVAGVAHFKRPDFYTQMMPPWLPAHAALVEISGVAEILGGIGLVVPKLRRAAGIGLIVLLVVIFPANIQMLLNARARAEPELLLWLRLPLQPVLIWWVWVVSGTEGSTTP